MKTLGQFSAKLNSDGLQQRPLVLQGDGIAQPVNGG
jgi:hypothetical protein